MKKKQKKRVPICFKRWKRAPWAAFVSMKKIVSIGVLCVTCSILTFKSQPMLAQGGTKSANDTLKTILNELVVTAGRATPFQPLVKVVAVIQQKEIERAAVQNLTDLLRYIQGADLRSRGSEGVQADINILGGTFDQTMIMINGINFTDPQTGHHSLNIPVEISQIESIEILQGPGAWSNGSIAYSGAINIKTKKPSETGADISIAGGENGYFKTGANLSFISNKYKKHEEGKGWSFSGIAGGGYNSSSGYADNTDFGIANFYTNLSLSKNKSSIVIQAGFQEKNFGANSFYSIAYPEQYESLKTFLSSIQYQYQSDRLQIQTSIYQRRLFDRFELFRNDSPTWYKGHNYHQNDIFGANAQAAYRWSKAGTSVIGLDYRLEHIYSTLLGDLLASGVKAPFEDGIEYTRGRGREIPSIYVKHILHFEKWRFCAGILVNNTYNSNRDSYGARFYAGLSADYDFNRNLELNCWINNSSRNPSFTDLDYKSPTQTGNINLKPEEAVAGQIGIKYKKSVFHTSLSVFYRYGYRIIDWTRESGSDQWKAGNITDVRSAGVEYNATFSWKNSFVNQAGFTYTILNVRKNSDNLLSLYATDYLKHKASAFVDHSIISKLSARWDISFQKRNGSYADKAGKEILYKSFVLADLKLQWSENRYKVFVEATNIFDKDYLYIGNLPQPGRWLKAGLVLNL